MVVQSILLSILASSDAVEAVNHIVEPLVDPLKALVHPVESLIHDLESLVVFGEVILNCRKERRGFFFHNSFYDRRDRFADNLSEFAFLLVGKSFWSHARSIAHLIP